MVIQIYYDVATGLPAVDRNREYVQRGTRVQWSGDVGADTAWLVRFTGASPFEGEQAEFESQSKAATPVGASIRDGAPDGSYPYVVKLIVNDGADTLGVDPEIIVRDPD